MDIYEKAHELADLLQQSESYKAYLKAREALYRDQEQAQLLHEFKKKQTELQILEYYGETDMDSKSQLDDIYHSLTLSPLISEFLNAEYVLGKLLNDVQKIIGKDLELGEEFEVSPNNLN